MKSQKAEKHGSGDEPGLPRVQAALRLSAPPPRPPHCVGAAGAAAQVPILKEHFPT